MEVHAQSTEFATIEGHVFNRNSGLVVDNAHVTLADGYGQGMEGQKTGTDGFYFFEGVSAGPDVLSPPGPAYVFVACASGGKKYVQGGVIHLPLRPDLLQRNIYIDMPKSITACENIPFFQ